MGFEGRKNATLLLLVITKMLILIDLCYFTLISAHDFMSHLNITHYHLKSKNHKSSSSKELLANNLRSNAMSTKLNFRSISFNKQVFCTSLFCNCVIFFIRKCFKNPYISCHLKSSLKTDLNLSRILKILKPDCLSWLSLMLSKI